MLTLNEYAKQQYLIELLEVCTQALEEASTRLNESAYLQIAEFAAIARDLLQHESKRKQLH